MICWLLGKLCCKRLVFFQFFHLSPRQEGSERRSLLNIYPPNVPAFPPSPRSPFPDTGKTAGKTCLHKVGAAANWVDVIDHRGCSPGKPAMVSAWVASLSQPVAVNTDLNGPLRADRFRGKFKSGELGCLWERAVSLGDAGFQGQESFYFHPPFNQGVRILVPHLFKDNYFKIKKK